jgi:dienelactone hydrolase
VKHGEIKAIVLLSGTATGNALSHIASSGVAVFGAAAEGDDGGNAAAGVRQAIGASKNPKSTIQIYPGSAHGVAMFARNSELRPLIVKWLQSQLMP